MANEVKRGKLFVVSAPSGGGKTSIVTEVIKRLKPKYNLARITTYTSRNPRPGEVNGQDYYFLSSSEFDKKAAQGFFLETTEYNHKKYGSPASILDELAAGKSLFVIPDRPGAKSTHKVVPDAVMIWIMPPDLKTLQSRLTTRGDLTDEQLHARLALAEEELKEEHKQRLFKYHITNHEFNRAVADLMMIIEDELG